MLPFLWICNRTRNCRCDSRPGESLPVQGDGARTIGPIQPGFAAAHGLLHFYHVIDRNLLAHGKQSGPARHDGGLERMASAAKGGGTKITETVAPGSLWRRKQRWKTGTFLPGMFKNLSALAGRDPGAARACRNRWKLGVLGPEAAGDALTRILVSG